MADRYPTYFGPVRAQANDAPEAFSKEELVQIRARRLEADLVRAQGFAWPAERRFETMLPFARDQEPRVVPGERFVSGVRVIVH